jgi:hypothetical protein
VPEARFTTVNASFCASISNAAPEATDLEGNPYFSMIARPDATLLSWRKNAPKEAVKTCELPPVPTRGSSQTTEELWALWISSILTIAFRLRIVHVLWGFRLEHPTCKNPFAASEQVIESAFRVCNRLFELDQGVQLRKDFDLLWDVLHSCIKGERHAQIQTDILCVQLQPSHVKITHLVAHLVSVFAPTSVGAAAKAHVRIMTLATSPVQEGQVRIRVRKVLSGAHAYHAMHQNTPNANPLLPSAVHGAFLTGLAHESSPAVWRTIALHTPPEPEKLTLAELTAKLTAFAETEDRLGASAQSSKKQTAAAAKSNASTPEKGGDLRESLGKAQVSAQSIPRSSSSGNCFACGKDDHGLQTCTNRAAIADLKKNLETKLPQPRMRAAAELILKNHHSSTSSSSKTKNAPSKDKDRRASKDADRGPGRKPGQRAAAAQNSRTPGSKSSHSRSRRKRSMRPPTPPRPRGLPSIPSHVVNNRAARPSRTPYPSRAAGVRRRTFIPRGLRAHAREQRVLRERHTHADTVRNLVLLNSLAMNLPADTSSPFAQELNRSTTAPTPRMRMTRPLQATRGTYVPPHLRRCARATYGQDADRASSTYAAPDLHTAPSSGARGVRHITGFSWKNLCMISAALICAAFLFFACFRFVQFLWDRPSPSSPSSVKGLFTSDPMGVLFAFISGFLLIVCLSLHFLSFPKIRIGSRAPRVVCPL